MPHARDVTGFRHLGDEEIASLAYLVTMRWAAANAAVTGAVGEYYEERLRGLADRQRRSSRGGC